MASLRPDWHFQPPSPKLRRAKGETDPPLALSATFSRVAWPRRDDPPKNKELASCLASSRLLLLTFQLIRLPSGTRIRCWARPWRRSRPYSRCWCRCRRSRRCCRGWCWRRCRTRPTRTHRTIEDFRQGEFRHAIIGVTTCFPNIIGAISVGCEVAPRNCEWNPQRPRIADWIVDVYLI